MLNRAEWRRDTLLNRIQSFLLVGFMCGFLAALGYLVGGTDGLMILLVFSLLLLSLSPAATPRLLLRLYGARRLFPEEVPLLHAMLRELSGRAELPAVPNLFYIPSRMVNAFTVGDRRNAAVAMTAGLLVSLNGREMAGVLAHEISHLCNGDVKVMGLADLIGRLTHFLSLLGQLMLLFNLPMLWSMGVHVNLWALALLVFAPQIALLSQLGLSRIREYHADLNAALLTGDPEGLASALVKIERGSRSWKRILWPGVGMPEPSWLRTHPPIEERIRRLLMLRPQLDRQRQDAGFWLDRARIPHRAQRDPRYHWSGLWY